MFDRDYKVEKKFSAIIILDMNIIFFCCFRDL